MYLLTQWNLSIVIYAYVPIVESCMQLVFKNYQNSGCIYQDKNEEWMKR